MKMRGPDGLHSRQSSATTEQWTAGGEKSLESALLSINNLFHVTDTGQTDKSPFVYSHRAMSVKIILFQQHEFFQALKADVGISIGN